MFIRTGLVYRNVNRCPHTAPLFPLNRTQTPTGPNEQNYRGTSFLSRGGGEGNGCHLRVVPPLGNFIEGQAHPNVFAFLQFPLNQGLCILCFAKFPSHLFFVFAFRWFRVFHRGWYVYFPIVFRSNSLYNLYIFIFFLYIF